jgi:hypothetical protein
MQFNIIPKYVDMKAPYIRFHSTRRSLEDLRRIEPKAHQVYRKYMDELNAVDVKELAIHRRVSRLNYSRRCAEASAVQAHNEARHPVGSRDGDRLRD